MKIGFIGLGNMGQPMARNLVAAGHEVIGYDIAARLDLPFACADTPIAAATACDVVITMLTSGAIVEKVITQIIPHLASGTLLIDCSTINVGEARIIANLCDAAGLSMVDAPVSGGIAAAASASLTFMVGGTDAAFTRAQPLLEAMGKKIVHCGDTGTGQAAKICNNMILGITMIGTCEAFALADNIGLSRDKLYDVVSGASGQSWSMTSYCPAPDIGPASPADNEYKPGFSADLMLKDLRLSQIAAEMSGVNTQMGALAADLYRRFVEDEDGAGQDFSAMLKRLT